MLASMGFETVEFVEVTPETLEAAVEDFSRRIGDNDIPSDGLVLLYDDIAYGASLAAPPNSPETPLPLSGRTSSRRPPSPILNGAPPGRDLSIRWPYSSQWSWRGPP